MVYLKIEEENVYVKTPYSEAFVLAARNLQGKFDSITKTWKFSIEELTLLRKSLKEIFGEDGIEPTERVTVEVDMNSLLNGHEDHFDLFGFTLVKRFHRHAPVKMEEGVIVVQGGFPLKTESFKYPILDVQENTILRVKNIPIQKVEQEKERGINGIKVVQPLEKHKIYDSVIEEKKKNETMAGIEQILKMERI